MGEFLYFGHTLHVRTCGCLLQDESQHDRQQLKVHTAAAASLESLALRMPRHIPVVSALVWKKGRREKESVNRKIVSSLSLCKIAYHTGSPRYGTGLLPPSVKNFCGATFFAAFLAGKDFVHERARGRTGGPDRRDGRQWEVGRPGTQGRCA